MSFILKNRRVNIYAKTNMNFVKRDNSYSNQQPRMGNWGTGSSNNCSQPCATSTGITTAPIAGWRKSLDCSYDCSCNQTISFTQTPGGFLFGPGSIVTQAPSATGTIVSIDTSGFQSILISVDDCFNHPFFTPGNPVLIDGVALTTPFIVSEPSSFENLGNNRADPLTTEIYKDTWAECSGPCVTKPTRTKKPLIKSGQQYNSSVKDKKYAFSYSQYRQNLRCLSYERSQEKFLPSSNGTIPPGYNIPTPTVYKKSGCNGCCKCCTKTQALLMAADGDVPLAPGSRITSPIEGTVLEWNTIYNNQGVPAFYVVVALDDNDPCDGFSTGQSLNGTFQPIFWILDLGSFPGNCDGTRGSNATIYKPSNKKFQVQGGVSSSTRLERLKLNTIQGSRIRTRIDNNACDQDSCDPTSKKFTLGFRSAEPRFVTNPNEGGDKTAGFVPTRWRQAYIAHGRAIGNIFQRTSSYDTAGHDTRPSLPYSVGSIRGCPCPAGTN